MPRDDERLFFLRSPDETDALANAIAPTLTAGDCFLLEGPVGAGKSAFARALILALLEEREDVPSPTFTLVQTYEGPDFDIWHCDLYRLTSPDELVELGLDEAFENAATLIEWPDRLGDMVPSSAQRLSFAVAAEDGARELRVQGDQRWTKIELGHS